MTRNTNPITYTYDVEGRTITITRRHVGTAYARNGNVGNASEYFVWDASIDGESYGGSYEDRATAYEYARAHIIGIPYYWHSNYPNRARNVRNYNVVREEMKNNYRGMVKS